MPFLYTDLDLKYCVCCFFCHQQFCCNITISLIGDFQICNSVSLQQCEIQLEVSWKFITKLMIFVENSLITLELMCYKDLFCLITSKSANCHLHSYETSRRGFCSIDGLNGLQHNFHMSISHEKNTRKGLVESRPIIQGKLLRRQIKYQCMMDHTEKTCCFQETQTKKGSLEQKENNKPNKINDNKENPLLLFLKITQTRGQLNYGRQIKVKGLFKIYWMR